MYVDGDDPDVVVTAIFRGGQLVGSSTLNMRELALMYEAGARLRDPLTPDQEATEREYQAWRHPPLTDRVTARAGGKPS